MTAERSADNLGDKGPACVHPTTRNWCAPRAFVDSQTSNGGHKLTTCRHSDSAAAGTCAGSLSNRAAIRRTGSAAMPP